MPETTTVTPQETAKQEFTSGLDRLSNDDLFKESPVSTEATTELKGGSTLPNETVTETKKEEEGFKEAAKPIDAETLKTEAKALGLAETATRAEIDAAKAAKPADAIEEGFKEEEAVQLSADEGTWKAYLESNNIAIPEDFSEEMGFEVVLEAEKAKIHEEYKEQLAITQEEILSPYPPEARLILDLMAQGQTLEEINKPFNEINTWKSMSKEELIRADLTAREGWTEDMVDHKMEELISGDARKLNIEYDILMNGIKQYEKQITEQRTNQLQQYQQAQTQLKEQKKSQDLNAFKTALDRMPTFMDRKLADVNKQSIINDYNNGAFERLMQNQEKKAKFMLFEKYGEQAMKYLQSRATEQATLDKAKTQHNVPPTIGGNGNSTQVTTGEKKNGMDRLAEDFPVN